ncbi:hypothetical protein [Micromonospora lupini]|uniref:Uncharacterized protein n=1 Tax=Micromonospora lupini str. Lupac 08 TaxID=1150864 RepID=I0L7D4_9ACTN|nr:hypothetical protein [Micromonospora lupini]CCH19731.1 Protein of unknown function [Micromonospora lupini str. Lupac 08]
MEEGRPCSGITAAVPTAMRARRSSTSAVAAPASGLTTLRVVGQPTGSDDIADTEGHLAGAYDAADHTLVLIRPDGYIALISDAGDVSAVSHYLGAIA